MPDENERKVPGFYVVNALYRATAQAALDADMSMSEFMRQLLMSSPAIKEAARDKHLDLSGIEPKQRGGYRERKPVEKPAIARNATQAPVKAFTGRNGHSRPVDADTDASDENEPRYEPVDGA